MNQFAADSRTVKKRIIILAVVAALLLSGLGLQSFLQRNAFRVTATNPKLSDVSVLTPFIKLQFSEPVEPDSVKFNDPTKLISSVDTKGAVVTVNLKFDLKADTKYRLILTSAMNNQGEEVTDYDLSFTAKNIPYDQLPKDQQQSAFDRQSDLPYSVDFVDFQNFNALLDYGMTADQLETMKQWVIDYANQINVRFSSLALDPATINYAPYDPEGDGITRASIVLVLDGTRYPTTIEYDQLSDAVQVVIKDSGGKVLFDSGGGSGGN